MYQIDEYMNKTKKKKKKQHHHHHSYCNNLFLWNSSNHVFHLWCTKNNSKIHVFAFTSTDKLRSVQKTHTTHTIPHPTSSSYNTFISWLFVNCQTHFRWNGQFCANWFISIQFMFSLYLHKLAYSLEQFVWN